MRDNEIVLLAPTLAALTAPAGETVSLAAVTAKMPTGCEDGDFQRVSK
jgi:hypothetical protein